MTAKYKRISPSRRRKMISDLYATLVRAETEVHAAEERERRLATAQGESDAALAAKYNIGASRY